MLSAGQLVHPVVRPVLPHGRQVVRHQKVVQQAHLWWHAHHARRDPHTAGPLPVLLGARGCVHPVQTTSPTPPHARRRQLSHHDGDELHQSVADDGPHRLEPLGTLLGVRVQQLAKGGGALALLLLEPLEPLTAAHKGRDRGTRGVCRGSIAGVRCCSSRGRLPAAQQDLLATHLLGCAMAGCTVVRSLSITLSSLAWRRR